MLPNSRIIPPNNNNNNINKNLRARSNSAVNDNSMKKGFMSRLLTSPNGPKEYNTNGATRPKYESVLGIQTKEDYATWGTPRITSPDQKAMKTSSSFGKLFKKKAKTNEDNENIFEDDQPKVRPIHSSSRKHTKIPLAPPPNYPRTRAISQPNQQHFLTNLPDQYLAKRQPTVLAPTLPIAADQQHQKKEQLLVSPIIPTEEPTMDHKIPEISLMNKRSSSALSNRKSSGSYSIYSTFGGNESEYSIEEPKVRSATPPVPVPVITNNNDSKRWENSRTLVAGESENLFSTVDERQHNDDDEEEEEEEEEEDDNNSETITEDSSETTDDEFVDATGFSQEDIERERRMILEKNLSKRLSGGHFGSAGGLVLSINQSSDDFSSSSSPLPLPTATKRKSQKIPADDELAQSLLNWKRHSDNSKRWSVRNSTGATTTTATTVMEDTGDKHSSTITVIDMRSTTNGDSPHAITDKTTISNETEQQEKVKQTEEEEELSVPDKLALRKEAEEALTGANTPPATKTTFVKVIDSNSIPKAPVAPTASLPLPPLPPLTTQTTLLKTLSASDAAKSEKYSSSEFSKTLDDVWKTSDDTLHLFDDDRTKQLQTSIQIKVADHDADPSKEGVVVDDKIKETATSLWNEDETVVVKERMAEWLGQGKPFENAILQEYMAFFDFTEMRLDSAFRKLCSKLYFKAEAQQIDRILESFANRYWDCNPSCLFGSADVVYAVVYSLLLLNTDLHVAQGNHARMTRSEFIRNTMSTVRDQRDHEELMGHKKRSTVSNRNWESELEYYLKEMYISVKNYQILQPLSRKSSLSKRGSILGNRRVIGLKRSVNSIIRKSGRESMLVLENHDQVSSSSSFSPPPPPPPRLSISSGHTRPLTPSSSMKSPRRESFSSTNSSAASFSSRCGSPTMIPQQQQQHSQQPMMQYLNSNASSLFSSRPPYYKEGVVMRKHLLENANHKARHREWRECYLEVHEGELRMYTLQSNQNQLGDKGLFRHSSAAHFNLADISNSNNSSNRLSSRPSSPASFGGVLPNNSNSNNKWATHSQLVGKIELNHTLSNPLPPPGYNRQRPHVFAIQQSDGGVYLFQVTNAEQTHEWVSTCNYWAARESKEPLPGGVGNMEYGWGACLNDVIMDLDAARKGYDQKVNYFSTQDPDSIMINDWMPPSATMVSSQLNEKDQYNVLQKHLVELNEEINQHRDIKSKIMIKFPTKCNNYPKVLSNWEARSKYLLHDIIKYQNYCDSLEKSIQMQQDLIEEDVDSEEDKSIATGSLSPSSNNNNNKLEYQTHTLDLFEEINQELSLNL